MPTRRRTHSTNDLFEIFPDLPWARRRTTVEKKGKVQQQVEVVRERALVSIFRQRAATAWVRGALAGFWRRT
jgi:hypothetical protein